MPRALGLAGLLLGLWAASVEARPKIGVALGGGGARGMAHAGVLEWLEEHRIPVDVLTGTSMGGIIGGGFATGMSGVEIRELLAEIDWDKMFIGEAPYRLKTFRRKDDARLFPSRFSFGFHKGLRLSSGLDPGHQVDLLLSRIALPYADIQDFDQLPTPFRVTATDMSTSELVVLGNGSLAQAMRATMSLPGVFPPVVRDGHVLIDGGVLNNVPADVARDLGADIVIAVDVAYVPGSADPAQTMFGILSQMMDVFMSYTTRQLLRSADIVIRPPLKDYGTLDWRKNKELAELGYKAAASCSNQLLPLALDEAAWAEYQARRQARLRLPPPRPTQLTITGLDNAREQRWISKRLEKHLEVPFDRETLEHDLTQLTGTDRYDSIAYRLLRNDQGEQLALDVCPNPFGSTNFVLGMAIDNISTTDLRFSVKGRMTAFDVLGFGSELRVDLRLGSPLGVAAEFYQPISSSGLFIAPHAAITQTLRPVYGPTSESLLGQSRLSRFGGGADLGYTFGSTVELRLGYETNYVNTSVYVGEATLPSLDGWEHVATARFGLDTLDSAIVPSRGVRLQGTVRHVLDGPEPGDPNEQSTFSEHPILAEATFSWYHPWNEPHIVFFNASGATSFDTRPVGLYRFALGGPTRLSAWRGDELSGLHTAVTSAGYLRRVGRLPDFLGGPAFLGGWGEIGSAFDDLETADIHFNGTVALIAETLLGPLMLGGSLGVEGEGRIFFTLGTVFR